VMTVRFTQVMTTKVELKVLRDRAKIGVARGQKERVKRKQRHRGKLGRRQREWRQEQRSCPRSKPLRSSQRHS